MALSAATTDEELVRIRGPNGGFVDSTGSLGCSVSRGAIASLSLILLILGVGRGVSSVSPWARDGISATTFGVPTILWLTFTQFPAPAMRGAARADQAVGASSPHWANTAIPNAIWPWPSAEVEFLIRTQPAQER